jgi:Glyoxalase/Bleomycin resistance protein/Dioxygenase superfamily
VSNAFDHFAIGTQTLTDGWELFGGELGGTWAYGGHSSGYWWGQLSFAAGPKVELLTPTGGPDAAFLERFLAGHGAGPHHFNFATDDIEDTLPRHAGRRDGGGRGRGGRQAARADGRAGGLAQPSSTIKTDTKSRLSIPGFLPRAVTSAPTSLLIHSRGHLEPVD